jgi:SAM-dependent methyltransferase/glycosyltransferase involved in cell wall biosynthesis
MSGDALAISTIVPARNCASQLQACLAALQATEGIDHEIIVVDDASTDDTSAVALRHGARVRRLDRQSGPATARNRGAAEARGEYLVFIDADVCVQPGTMRQFAATFHEQPTVDAVFGSYDQEPRSRNFVSQYRNLLHHFVHQESRTEATTFWAGCGAIKRHVFLEMGGFDTAFRRPCIEDIELGARLRRLGHRIVLNKEIQVSHLKRWTVWNLIRTDLWDRAVPWTEHILREQRLPSDLNLNLTHRISTLAAVVLAIWIAVAIWYWPWLLLLLVILASGMVCADRWTDFRPVPLGAQLLLIAAAAAAAALTAVHFRQWALIPAAALGTVWLVNWRMYGLFARLKGPAFAIAIVPLHVLYYWYCTFGLCIGLGRFLSSRFIAPCKPSSALSDTPQKFPVDSATQDDTVTNRGFKLNEAASYDPVARQFAELSSRYSASLARCLVDHARLREDAQVLDVGTGAGLVALCAARHLSPRGRVLGIDLSEEMIAVAQQAAQAEGLSVPVEFERMDAEELDVNEATFDVVLSLFALAHLPNPRAALSEMRRVLRPLGRVVIGIGGGPTWCSWEGTRVRLGHLRRRWSSWQGRCLIAPEFLDRLVLRRLPEAKVAPETTWARHRGLRSHAAVQWMREAGFSDVQSSWVGSEAVVDSVDDFWNLQATFSTFARQRLARAPADAVRDIREEFTRAARQVKARGGTLLYPFGATLISGIRR